MKIGTCKLCLEEKPLLKKSHIIPDFIYREGKIYHGDHSIHRINLKRSVKSLFSKNGIQYSGEYEGGILCRKCDGEIIKQYEDYGRKLLYGGKLKPVPAYTYSRGKVVISNVSYTNIKLFFLSILWRASISSRPFFKEIQLSAERKEELRKMIISGDAGKNTDYPITFAWDFGKDPKLKQYMGQPVSINENESHFFVFPAYFVHIYNHIDLVPKKFRNFSIYDSGMIKCFATPPDQVWQLLKKLYG